MEENNHDNSVDEPPIANLSTPVKDRDGVAIASFVLSLIPYALFLFIFVETNKNENSQTPWLIMIYYSTFGIPLKIGSIVMGILGRKSKARVFAYLGIILSMLLVLIFILFAYSNR